MAAKCGRDGCINDGNSSGRKAGVKPGGEGHPPTLELLNAQ